MPNQLSPLLKAWKEIWSIFISDPAFRKYFTNTADYTVRMNTTKRIASNSGTIRLPGNRGTDEDHFISFIKYDNRIDIFDPADTSGRYNSFLTDRVKNKIATLSARPVRVLNYHPQCHDGDTFCQTWSLAWMKPSLRKNVTGVRTSNQSMTAMHKICRAIANSKKFSEYMLDPPNAASFQRVINKSCRDYGVIPPLTIAGFVEMSKHITLAQIKDIFG